MPSGNSGATCPPARTSELATAIDVLDGRVVALESVVEQVEMKCAPVLAERPTSVAPTAVPAAPVVASPASRLLWNSIERVTRVVERLGVLRENLEA